MKLRVLMKKFLVVNCDDPLRDCRIWFWPADRKRLTPVLSSESHPKSAISKLLKNGNLVDNLFEAECLVSNLTSVQCSQL